jgi:hypothetical protein
MKKRRKQYYGYEVDDKFIGELNYKTIAIIMNNSWNRDNHKTTVRSFRTENIDLLAGNNTVAIFTNFHNKIKSNKN